MNKVANQLRYGNGVQQDPAQAIAWYWRAAQKGNIVALANLAECYMGGEGVEVDPQKALQIYEELFNSEQCVSAFELGKFYEKGLVVERSVNRAAEYFRIARANKHPEAFQALKNLGFDG